MLSLWEYVDICILLSQEETRSLQTMWIFFDRGVNYLSVAIRIMYVFFAGAATVQSIIYEDEEGTLGLVRFGSTSVARTRGWRACAN